MTQAEHDDLVAVEAALGDLQRRIDVATPCHKKNEHSGLTCSQHWVRLYGEEPNGRGRWLLTYDEHCKIPVNEFCRPCLAHWLVVAARNQLLEELR